MKEKIDFKILQDELREKIREFYPYFFGFYILSLLFSIPSPTWRAFFYWPAFHGAMIFFTILFLLTFKFNFKALESNFEKSLLRKRIAAISWRTWIKIGVITAVILFALLKEISIFNFIVLLFALVSFFFILDSRLAASGALVFLVACPFLLILKRDAWAETAAIYAYYFLVITVLTQVRELSLDNKKKNNLVDKLGNE